MNKILIVVVILLILGGGGYFGYRFLISRWSTQQVEPGIGAATLCDNTKHICGDFSKTADSGTLRVVLFSKSGPPGGIEVDAGAKPGADHYYMKFSDNSGVALFEGIPAGNYYIYFNGNNFPTKYGDSPTETVQIIKEGEKIIEIHLGQ